MLIICSECGKEYSDQAKSCPHCGAKTSQNRYISSNTRTRFSFMKLLFIIGIILVVIFIIGNNQGHVTTDIEWGYMPSSEYYELRLAATTSAVYGDGSGTLSKASFNTLGKDVKKAKGIWFKNSNVNFRTQIFDDDTGEMVTLTDGEHVAVFMFRDGNNYVQYTFADEDFIETLGMSQYNFFGGYKITIK